MYRGSGFAAIGFVLFIAGCTSLPGQCPVNEQPENKGPRTLLEWNFPKKEEDKKNEKNDQKDEETSDKEKMKNGEKKENGKNGEEKKDNKAKEEDKADDKSQEAEDPHARLDPDRPHFPEASTTVGLDHVVLESGFTYNTSGGYFNRYSFPEALLRVGLFYDWLEFRIAENVNGENVANPLGQKSTLFGAGDLQIGVKLALTEQKQWWPESVLLLQMTVPSGSPGFSADRVLPGMHYNCSWEVIKDKLSVEAILFADGTVDNNGHTYTLLGHGVTAVYDLTKNLLTFGEIDSYYSLGESSGPQHYFIGGFVYYITKNFEIDIRSGVGLNQHAQGYLLGTGFAVRY